MKIEDFDFDKTLNPLDPMNLDQFHDMIRFTYHFYPVGQGLFGAGFLSRHLDISPSFLWVYDCGTSSSELLIHRGISNLGSHSGNRKRIDLLTISHFDKDHISGITRLLREFKVGTILLPYMPLVERIVIGLNENSSDNLPLMGFYLNPALYLLGQEGAEIERIVFVPPSENGPDYPNDEQAPVNVAPDGDDSLELDGAEKWPTQEDAEAFRQASLHRNRKTKVQLLKPGSRLRLRRFNWEFIPYNDAPKSPIPNAFSEIVSKECRKLLSDESASIYEESLKKIVGAYKTQFGKSSKQKNIISLFLYSGPIYMNLQTCHLTSSQSFGWKTRQSSAFSIYSKKFSRLEREVDDPRCSILYAGDGYLNKQEKLERLIRYLDPRRVRRIGVFQVMHHGAVSSWHKGVAEAIAATFSVFSSDPEHKKLRHPHSEVLRDFWRFGAVQVNRTRDFTASGHFRILHPLGSGTF